MPKSFVLFAAAFFFVACTKNQTTETLPASLPEQTLTDVSYGSDAAQKMDVYLPAGRTITATKFLVLIHGGAWSTGDKSDFNEYIPVFRQRLPGYALFNLNYRLAAFPSTNPFPTQETDVKTALNFIITKGEEYKFNKEKLALLGASAGGHLALLQGYKNNSPKVKALVDMFGPTDMAALYSSSPSFTLLALQALLGGTPTTAAASFHASSPLNFVSTQNPPTLILHGQIDPIVPIAQSTALKNAIQAAGGTVKMVTYPGEGHSWTGPALQDTYAHITEFLNQYNQ